MGHGMNYRKAPPRPTRLLLQVVAIASTGAALGAVACSGDVATGGGSVAIEAGDEHEILGVVDGGTHSDVVTGVLPNPDAADDHAVSGAVDGPVGVVPLEGGTEGGDDGGGEDGPVGVVVHPDGGTD